MNIGLLTLPFNNNYGGYLQAYALMTVLKQMGHNVELINRRPQKRPLKSRIKLIILNIIDIIKSGKKKNIIPNQEKIFYRRGQNMFVFTDKWIRPKTAPIFSTKQLKKICYGRYEIVVVGSDQVWRPDYVPNINEFFLDFLNSGTKRFSYAASFGNSHPFFTSKQIKNCGKALDKFSHISVREKSAIDIFEAFNWPSEKNVEVVLDPTFLLTKEDYCGLINCNSDKYKKKVTCYILDNSLEIEEFATKFGIIMHKEVKFFLDGKKWKKDDYVLPSIDDWLTSFRDSDYIVTDSFHGTVFSIIFNKPFVTLQNYSRGNDRMEDLLKMFGLEKQLFKIENDMDDISFDINWSRVNDILSDKREESYKYLVRALKE